MSPCDHISDGWQCICVYFRLADEIAQKKLESVSIDVSESIHNLQACDSAFNHSISQLTEVPFEKVNENLQSQLKNLKTIQLNINNIIGNVHETSALLKELPDKI